MDKKTYDIVKSVADKYNLPLEVWLPIALKESGLNPLSHALTSKEDSRGIFQVNVYAHPDANSSKLYDAKYNAEYWIPSLAKGYQQGKNKGLVGLELTKYVDKNVQRPAKESPALTTYYNQVIKSQPSWTVDEKNGTISFKNLPDGSALGTGQGTAKAPLNTTNGSAITLKDGVRYENGKWLDENDNVIPESQGILDQVTGFLKTGIVKIGLFIALLFFVYLLFKDSVPAVPTPDKIISEVK